MAVGVAKVAYSFGHSGNFLGENTGRDLKLLSRKSRKKYKPVYGISHA